MLLLDRPELYTTLTKLHVFDLDVDEVVYLDADTLVVANVDKLFDYVNNAVFAAAPDIGWPDCFNSGVFVARPSPQLFEGLVTFAKANTSFDGT